MLAKAISRCSLPLLIACMGCNGQQNKKQPVIPPNMYLVKPVSKNNSKLKDSTTMQQHPVEELRIGQGNFFSYALPPGWRVGEDGQFALSLVAPDNKAFTVMVGNAGLFPDYHPGQYVYEKMMAMQPANLQVSNAVNAKPISGFQQAYAFDIAYQANGAAYRGIAICHVAPYYGGCTMAMTAAISESSQWNSYASWLPKVAQQIAATNGAAFGMRGVMQQNLRNSTAYAEAAKEYRDWSQKKWQEVTDYRNQVNDKQNEQFRDNLDAVITYNNPNNNNVPVQLSTQYKYYWMDKQGQVLGTNDRSANPNQSSTGEWQQLDPVHK